MADRPPEVCAFCGEGEEAGELRNTTDEDILAHYLCLLYSPLVISIPLKDSQDANNDFDIDSVKKEIRRGRKTICSHCGKKGGTIGCNVGKCNKTYHYLCVKRARGVHIHDEAKEMYIIYCEKHADDSSRPKERTPKSSKRSRSLSGTNGTRRKQKSTSKSPFSKKEKNSKKCAGVKKPTNKRTPKSSKESQSVSGSNETPTQMTQKYTTESPSPKRRRLDNIFDHVKKNSEDDMAVPSTSGTCRRNGRTVSDSERKSELSDRSPVDPEYDNDTSAGELKKTVHVSSTESPSSCDSESLLTPTPKITRTISLSGYPKKYKKRTKKRNNPELDDALTTMTSDERNAHSLLYDATGGSLMSQDWSAPQNYNNQTDSEGYATDVPASLVIITPETELANSAPSISKPGSPSAKESESPPTTSVSPDARSDKTPLHVKDTSHSSYLSPQQLRQISANFKNGTYAKTFGSMVPQIQIQSTIESAKKTQAIIEDGNLSSEGSIDPNTSLQPTEQHSSDSDALQSHSGIGSRTSQTEISAGFPSKMELSLNNEQKSLLWKSYRLIQKEMKMSVMEPGTAQAFWSLCLENKCREFLLTMIQKDTKSVVHKIIHEDPDDKDYELAFALLQASGCFEDFIKAGDSDTSSTSTITEREPIDENESSLTSGPSIHNGPAEFEGQETSSNTSQTMMELEFPQTSPGGEEGTIGDKDNSRIDACSPGIFSVSRRENEECPQSAPSEGRPQSAPSEGRPQSAPSEGRPQSAPSEGRPQSAPSGRRPQSAPSGRRPQSAPSGRRPQSAPSEERPQSPPSEGRPQSAPSEKRPQSGPSEERPQSPPSAENHSEIQLTLQKILQDLNTQRLQEQEVDGDAAFARSLVPFLRRVPEDQKLLTRIALQKIISSALSQNPQ